MLTPPRCVRLMELGPWRILLTAACIRVAVLLWAGGRIKPVEDGHYYHVLASRIAQGLGYTWLWPDGAVTYAAHYPVGYPALLALGYALFGANAVVGMSINAILGSLAAVAAFHVAKSVASPRAGVIAGVLVALHPALVAYTPAIMTEGVTASLLMIAAWFAIWARAPARRARWLAIGSLGALLGLIVLVRPQCLLLCPIYGVLAIPCRGGAFRARLIAGVTATCVALAICAPWALRNCTKMGRCVLVSANAGWNLLIGTAPEGRGSWMPLERVGVPEACSKEFREAFKDACFSRAALERIRSAPATWLALIPAKLSTTFDYSGAPGWYLHAANPHAFDLRAKVALGVLETLWERGLLALALLALGRRAGPNATLRRLGAVLAAASLLSPVAWLAYLALPLATLLLGRRLFADPPALLAAAAVLATALAHSVFFGAGRYSLVCFPMLAVLAATVGLSASEAGGTPTNDALLTTH